MVGELDPEMFDKAADLIEERGWFSYHVDPVNIHRSECIVTALNAATDIPLAQYYQVLMDHLGVDKLDDVFARNDAHTDYEAGKAWAIKTLRDIAQKLRDEEDK